MCCELEQLQTMDITTAPSSVTPRTDRASLARRRQQIHRTKEASSSVQPLHACAPVHLKTTSQKKAACTPSSLPAPPTTARLIRSTYRPDITAPVEPNVALLVHEVLQRPHHGDLSDYLKSASKEQLFDQTLCLAQHALEVLLGDSGHSLRMRRWQ